MKLFFLLILFLSSLANASDRFSGCLQLFANGKPPTISPAPMQRDFCYDSVAILHSGESKTPVFVAEKLLNDVLSKPHEKRTDIFFPDARLRSNERANLSVQAGL